MDNSDDDMMTWNDSTPPTSVQGSKESNLTLLPKKSRERYEFTYNQFMNWLREKDISSLSTSFSEEVVMSYFSEQSEKLSPNSLWTIYSMLRSTLTIHQNVNIAQYKKLKAFLKKMSDGYNPKKSKTLTTLDIHKFLNEAPDGKYLLSKVILIIGISGACRKHDLSQLKIENIEDLGSAVVINIPDTKTKKLRTFAITGKFYEIFKKYADMRPSVVDHNRFFLNYQNEKCTKQPVGINKIATVPKQIATFLHLKEPELYTGHCFRRSSATILVDVGADISSLKRHGRWKSNASAERYTEESLTINDSSSSSNNSALHTIKKEHLEEDQPSASNGFSPIHFLDPVLIKEEPELICDTVSNITSNITSFSELTSNTTSFSELPSNTTSCSRKRRRYRPFLTSKATLIKSFKFKFSLYKKQIKSLQEKTKKQDKRIEKLETALKELKTKSNH